MIQLINVSKLIFIYRSRYSFETSVVAIGNENYKLSFYRIFPNDKIVSLTIHKFEHISLRIIY